MRIARAISIALGSVIGVALAIVLRFARAIVTPPKHLPAKLTIRAVDRVRGRIVFAPNAVSRAPGRYGLWFGNDTGYARIGGVTAESALGIERELLEVVTGSPRAGMSARDSSWFYLTPDDLGVPSENLVVYGPVGALPAWHIPPAEGSADWVVHVHGRTASRAETLRSVRAARAAGWHSLAVTYRNDAGAAPSGDRRYGLGSTEWADVVAAVRFAEAHGAARIVLFGWSMGGLISLRAAAECAAQGSSPIVGVILESAVVSWANVFAQQARLVRLPRGFATAAQWLLGSRWAAGATGLAEPLDWRLLDGGALAARAAVPVLALHSAADSYVPIAPVRELAAQFPEWIEFHEFADAGHVRLWNTDSDTWDGIVQQWLRRR